MPLSIPPIWDPHIMADEVRRVAKKGCHAVPSPRTRTSSAGPHLRDHWDPFFQACEEEGTVICLHIVRAPPNRDAPGAPLDVMIRSRR